MDYEKKYKEALERMESYVKDGRFSQAFAALIFPEFEESDDEKIRKWLLDLYSKFNPDDNAIKGIPFSHVIAWLEKQGEQKPVEWSDGDIRHIQYAIDGLERYIKEHPDPEFGNATPCEKAAVRWLKSLKDRCLPQPKQEWSEEDEDMRYKATAVLNKLCASNQEFVFAHNTLVKVFYWLKSLRPQKRWKPSEEQMDALAKAVEESLGKDYHNQLSLLEYDIKNKAL